MSAYGDRALEAECDHIRNTLPGKKGAPNAGRNHELNISALKIFGLVLGGELEKADAVTALIRAAKDCGLEKGESLATIDSAWRAATPRSAPEKPKKLESKKKKAAKTNGTPVSTTTEDELAGHLICLADVEAQPIEWLWHHRIPLGAVTILDGVPGQGKSTALLDLAARVSTGRALPDDDDWHAAGGIVLLSAEDDIARTIRPRLDAAGADVSRVAALQSVPGRDGEAAMAALPDDLARVETSARRYHARLIIIDPITAYIPGVDAHRDSEVRRALAPLGELASRLGAAVVAVRHWTKAGGASAVHRGGGSIAFSGAARSVLAIGRDPSTPEGDDPDGRVLCSVKSNLGPLAPSLAFELVAAGSVTRVEWRGCCDLTADELAGAGNARDTARPRDEAEMFIADALASGPVLASAILDDIRTAGISDRTRDRAKSRLRVRSYRDGSSWYWAMQESKK